jgi:hypothetical protein
VLNLSRRALLIAKRDYLISVRSKSFLFGLIVFPLLFGGSSLGVAILKAKPDLRDRHVVLIDRTGKLADFVVQAAAAKSAKEMFEKKTGVQISPRYIVEPVAPEPGDPNLQRLALSGRVRNGELLRLSTSARLRMTRLRIPLPDRRTPQATPPRPPLRATPTPAPSTNCSRGSAAR